MTTETEVSATPIITLDREKIAEILPHRGSALIIDSVEILEEKSAIGHFLVHADDQRVIEHFGVLPGHCIAEFAHLTGAVMSLHQNQQGMFTLLTDSCIKNFMIALPGDILSCFVELSEPEGEPLIFTCAIRNQHTNLIAEVLFRGKIVSQRIMERLKRRK